MGARGGGFDAHGHAPRRAQGDAARSPGCVPPVVDGRNRRSRHARRGLDDAPRRGASHRARPLRIGNRRDALARPRSLGPARLDATVGAMKSRYDAEAALALVRELAPRASEVLALRTYSARLVGSEASLV